MSKNAPTVLITGATGQVGRQVIAKLANDSSVEVVAASRNAVTSDLGVRTVRFDYDDSKTMAPALAGIDRLFILTGYTVDMLRQSKSVVDHAQKAGVQHIVHLGACGADDTDVAHYGWHQFVERYIAGSGIAYTHLRPEIFMQNLFGYGGVPVAQNGVLRYYVGAARQSWIDAEDIAEVAAVVLKDPSSHARQIYRLGYDAATYDDIAKVLSEELNQPFRYEARPAAEFLEMVLKLGGEPAYMNCVFSSFDRLSRGELQGADQTFDNFFHLTGKSATTLRAFVRKHADRFRY